jgi:hypothetical protein
MLCSIQFTRVSMFTGLLVLTSLLPVARADDEQAVALDNIADNVKSAAVAAVPGVKLESATVEAVLVFGIEGESGGKEHEVEVTSEGQVLSNEAEDEADDAAAGDDSDDDASEAEGGESDEADAEHEISIPLSAVPAAALQAAKEAVDGLEPEEAEVESVLVYELVGTVNGKRVEIEVTSEGQVIETEDAD